MLKTTICYAIIQIMKKRIIKILSLVLALSLTIFSFSGCNKAEVKELGIPCEKQFQLGAMARCPWDIKVFEGKVYVGGGDYGINTGPTVIWAYDISSNEWINTGKVSDEAVSSFKIIAGKLTVPGTDPRGSSDYGNAYQLENGKWKTYTKIPNGIHNFDMVEFGGKIYAGLGVDFHNPPVAVGTAINEMFEFVPIYKNGAEVDADSMDLLQYRAYDLFVHNQNLYAMVCFTKDSGSTLEVYKLNGNQLEYFANASDMLATKQYGTNLLESKVSFGSNMYFSRGVLYKSSDLQSFSEVNLPNGENVCDLFVAEGKMYVLAYTGSDGDYQVSIYQTEDEQNFEKILDFDYSVRPLSFDKDGDTFYIGMGDRTLKNDKTGMILAVKK